MPYEGTACTPTSQDTLQSLLTEIEGVSQSINYNAGQVADALSGNQPESSGKDASIPQSAVERLRYVLYALQSAQGEISRSKRALGISEPIQKVVGANQSRY